MRIKAFQKQNNAGKIPSLDGLRAISILLVLFDHGAPSLPDYISESYLYLIFSNSALGVRIFFVISGYLITRLLLNEIDKHGDMSLKRFYVKRVLRIFPVFYLYVLVIILLQVFVGDVFYWRDIAIAGLFLWNMHALITGGSRPQGGGTADGMRNPHADGWYLMGHFWTLAMEEQFYLIWPFVMKKVKNRKTLIKICLWIVLLMPIIRIVVYMTVPTVRGQINNMLFTAGDSIMLGCMVALLEKSKYWDKLFKFLTDNKVVLLSVLYIFILDPMLHQQFKGSYELVVGISLTNIGIVSLIIWSINKQSLWHSFLNIRAVATVGVLSYSIYIWQQLFMFVQVKWMYLNIGDTKFYLNKFPQNIILVIIVSCISYYLYEKQFLKLKDRLSKKVSR